LPKGTRLEVAVSRFAFGSVLFVAACGGSANLCEKWADELEACDGDDFSVEECEEQTASCDADDLALLDDFYDCASDAGLFECDEDSPPATNMTDALEDIGAIFACAEPLEGLSEDCQGDMMTGSTGAVF
jgi:hypothetical protein